MMFLTPKSHLISKSAIVPYSSQNMFDLVNQIESYPQFLSWCDNSHILSQSPDEIVATLSINKGLFTQSFTTVNTLVIEAQRKIIQMTLKNGSFKQLDGTWSFQDLNDSACKINFEINFSFDNKLMDLSIAPIFSQIANTQLDAFIARAKTVY